MKQNQMYVCGCGGDKKCDCMVEVITSCDTCADTSPICCGEPMVLLEAKTADQGKEKHVPVVEKQEGGYLVKVGDVPHPMIEKHWITLLNFAPKMRFIENISRQTRNHKPFLLPMKKYWKWFLLQYSRVVGGVTEDFFKL